jgi:hypothetical protein
VTSPYLAPKIEAYNEHRRAVTDLQALVTQEKRDFTEAELRSVVDHGDAARDLYAEIEVLGEDEVQQAKVNAMAARVYEAIGDDGTGSDPELGVHSLVPSREQLTQMRSAIAEARGLRFTTDRLPRDMHTRAAVTQSLTGGRVGSTSGRLPEPRRLTRAVGLVPIPSTTAGTSRPKFGATSATAATAEVAAKPEAATITKLDIAIKQLARWTTLSRMALLSQENTLSDVVAWHAMAIAKDEDKLLIDAINTLAGAAIAFGAGDQRAPVRAAMAKVEDAVSAPCDAVLVHPDNYGLLAGFDPTDADEAGGRVVTFGNGVLYPSSSVPTGFVLVAAIRAAGRFIVADPTSVATTEALSTNETTVRTEELVGFDMALVGAAAKIDVVA